VLPSINYEQPVLFFDGVCNLCNSSVQTIIQLDKKQHFKFASLQSHLGKELLQSIQNPALDSVILYYRGKHYTESRAVLKVLAMLGFPYALATVACIIPPFIRNAAYHFIAKNRYRWFGKKDQCMMPDRALMSRFLE